MNPVRLRICGGLTRGSAIVARLSRRPDKTDWAAVRSSAAANRAATRKRMYRCIMLCAPYLDAESSEPRSNCASRGARERGGRIRHARLRYDDNHESGYICDLT